MSREQERQRRSRPHNINLSDEELEYLLEIDDRIRSAADDAIRRAMPNLRRIAISAGIETGTPYEDMLAEVIRDFRFDYEANLQAHAREEFHCRPRSMRTAVQAGSDGKGDAHA